MQHRVRFCGPGVFIVCDSERPLRESEIIIWISTPLVSQALLFEILPNCSHSPL